jgi:uncharacterized protein (TIGR02453 family)
MFTRELFAFLAELRENNNREWFDANRERYEEHVREPALDFVTAFAPHLQRIGPRFEADARRSGGSLFRINRDTRFAKDKSPYRANAGIIFRHEQGRSASAPGFYLHLEPGRSFAGIGIWHPDGPATLAIRSAIAEQGDRWTEVTRTPRLELVGDQLKRAPRGFDKDHPLIEDIKRRNFALHAPLTDAAVTQRGVIDRYAELCEQGAGLNRFLCDALQLPY